MRGQGTWLRAVAGCVAHRKTEGDDVKTDLLAVGTVALALAVGCSKPNESFSSASGSMGISRDESYLYAADGDNDALLVVRAENEELVATVKVGRQPEKVVVGVDDTVYVTNRYSRSVSVIRYGDWVQAQALEVGVEPVGLALSGDGRTLYVVNAATLGDAQVGSLLAIDVATLTPQWELPVGEEPRAVAIIGNKALVTLYKQGDVVTVDLDKHQVVRASTTVNEQLNQPLKSTSAGAGASFDQAAPVPPGFAPAKLHARGLESISASPDGTQAYVTALLTSDATLPGGPATAGVADMGFDNFSGKGAAGYGSSSGCMGSVATAALLTFTGDGEPLAHQPTGCGDVSVDQPPEVLMSGNPTLPVQRPSAAAVDSTGTFTYVVNHDSNNVMVVRNRGTASGAAGTGTLNAKEPANIASPAGSGMTVAVGNGPTGIALSKDGKRAWVYNLFDHTLQRIESQSERPVVTRTVALATDTLSTAEASGRRLFFSATDSRMNNLSVGISCATCHLEGREDGNVWQFTDGPRQTPLLAGRQLDRTAPFHWNGEFANFTNFMTHTVTQRMGGSVVTPAMESDLQAFIRSMPLPDNPHRQAVLTDAQARGLTVFNKAQCGTCHSGDTLTDNGFYDVGTFVTVADSSSNHKSDLLPKGLNTPSLIGLVRTAPFLHDGSAPTLEMRILRGKDKNLHGSTSQLTADEVRDLVEYLKTL